MTPAVEESMVDEQNMLLAMRPPRLTHSSARASAARRASAPPLALGVPQTPESKRPVSRHRFVCLFVCLLV